MGLWDILEEVFSWIYGILFRKNVWLFGGGVFWRFRVYSIRDGTERRLEGGSSWVMSIFLFCILLFL